MLPMNNSGRIPIVTPEILPATGKDYPAIDPGPNSVQC
ncbi:hypothetical protein SAEN8230_20630 [Salmonella enterica subsp. arizonae]|uniref:Uncharacterized protein n=1 Tax=Salmonella enterica subsp. arizonae TaxID=59203 RepID=A0A379TDU6_SALER|nr:Uncharacterised protein [Salmonella enterica subsp. arizonae]